MHPYLPYLLADINQARCTEIPIDIKHPLTFEEEMEALENCMEDAEPPHTFSYYCGLESINFPPAEQLSEADLRKVLDAFGHMMFSWNLHISLPENLPLPIAYKMTVQTLDTKTTIVESGYRVFEFCSGYAPDCIFKEYCSCLEIWNEADDDIDMTDNADNDPDALPF